MTLGWVLAHLWLSIMAVMQRDAVIVESTTRDRRAAAVVESVAVALRDTATAFHHGVWLVEGRGRENLTAELAGLSPHTPTWRPHQERVAVDERNLQIAWERRTPRNDHSLRWRRFVMREEASGYYDWVVGRGAMRPMGTALERRRSLSRRVPHLLWREEARWRGERRINGQIHDQLEIGSPKERLLMSVGRNPAVPRRLEYDFYLPGAGVVPVIWEWRHWKRDSQLGWVPRGHRITIAGALFQEVAYDRYAFAHADAESLLHVPPGAPPPYANERSTEGVQLPALGEVAPGVHVIDVGGFIVMAVEFDDFVVAAEAPENAPGFEAIPATRDTTPLTAALLDSIGRRCPGKPVRYAVLSHHHADHMGGAGVYAARGITLLVAPGHERAARAAARGYGVAPESIRIETVAGRRVLRDGRRKLEVINVGRNPHTDENLFLWLPSERLLFQGDLFYFQAGGVFPPSGRATMNRFFARWLRSHGLRPRAIYGVHNDGAAGPEWLERSIRWDRPLEEAGRARPF